MSDNEQPDAGQPDPAQPDPVEPHAAQPHAAQPDPVEPHAAQPSDWPTAPASGVEPDAGATGDAYAAAVVGDVGSDSRDIDEDEGDDWMDERAAMDREAGDYLREELMELLPRLSGTPLKEAETRLRDSLTDAHSPEARYLLRANGWTQGLPESDLWTAAAASTISPPQDPQTPAGDQAAVIALEHADWLAIVLGLVRRGVGARLDAKRVLRDILRLRGFWGDIDDPEGHLDVIESAIEVLVPLWQCLGIIDEDRRLTGVGPLGLPVALLRTWSPQATSDKLAPEVERAALDLLVDRPRPVEYLRKQLARQGTIIPLPDLREGLRYHQDVREYRDGWLGHVPALLQGVVLTHRITPDELRLGMLDGSADLDALDYVADEGGCSLATGGEMTSRWAIQGQPMPGDSGLAFEGPEGWLADFSAGDLIGLRYVDRVLTLKRLDLEALHAVDGSGDLAAVIEEAVADDEENGETGIPGASGADIVFRMLREHPGSLREPLPPLTELATDLRYGISNGNVCRRDVALGLHTHLSDEQRAARSKWSRLAQAWRRHGEMPDAETLAALAADLDRTGMVMLVAPDLVEDPGLEPVLEAMQGTVTGRLAAVPLTLRAAAAEARGDIAAFQAHLEEAVAADPAAPLPHCALADLAALGGDAHEADRLYRLGGLTDGRSEIDVLRPFLKPPAGGPGRNKPCPCGSGKKYKMCHGRTATHPLPSRAGWLWRKICMFAGRPPRRHVLLEWGGLVAGAAPYTREAAEESLENPLVGDFAIIDGGLLHEFLETVGDRLPSDERELAARWAQQPMRLMEVREVLPMRGVAVLDLLTREELEVADRRLVGQVQEMDVMFGRPLDDGSGALRFQSSPCGIARYQRPQLLELLRQGASARDLASALAPQAPAPQTTDGQELVFCTARYDLDDLDTAWLALAAELKADPEGDRLHLLNEQDTILGSAYQENGQLLLETNAVERLRALQELLQRIAPSARLIDESTQPFDLSEMSLKGSPSLGDEPEMPPEVIESLRRRLEERWLNDHIPALGALTPREAAAGERRDDLIALLDDFDWQDRKHPNPIRMDTSRLRAALGLDI